MQSQRDEYRNEIGEKRRRKKCSKLEVSRPRVKGTDKVVLALHAPQLATLTVS